MFFFGNAVGDSGVGDTSRLSQVDTTDELEARNHGAAAVRWERASTITNIRDYNRDGIVDTTDSLFARNNAAGISTHLKFLNLAVGSPPNAPAGDGGEDAGVASALAAPDRSARPRRPRPGWPVRSPRPASIAAAAAAGLLHDRGRGRLGRQRPSTTTRWMPCWPKWGSSNPPHGVMKIK